MGKRCKISRYIRIDDLEQYSLSQVINGVINIQKLKTADVIEVVHAEWIKNWEIGWSACSHCGKGYLWEDYKGVADWKYCPNCGAKIDNRREIERGGMEK